MGDGTGQSTSPLNDDVVMETAVGMLNLSSATEDTVEHVANDTRLQVLSSADIEQMIRSMFSQEKNYDSTTQTVIITIFALLIALGATGNSLVCYVVARNPAMRTPRNIFIINLAISDLTLCLFTQPCNLWILLTHAWHLGTFMCKFIPMFCGVNVFVSTISITAIALDRFQVIVYPTNNSMKRFGAVISLISVWLVSMVLATPMAVFSVVKPYNPIPPIVLYEVCVEDPDLEHFRRIYSIAVIIVQYLVPVASVIIAHLCISRKLRNRMLTLQQRHMTDVTSPASRHHQQTPGLTSKISGSGGGGVQLPVSAAQKEKRRLARNRKRKTNLLLMMIVVVFALSWLPLNAYNVIADFLPTVVQNFDNQVGKLAFPVCHLLVLCSACVNPLLYGWLNDNFRREFVKVLCTCCGHSCQCARCCAVCPSTVTMTTLATAAPSSKANREGEQDVDNAAVGGRLLPASSLAPPIYRNYNATEPKADAGDQNETGSKLNPTEPNGDQWSNV